MKHIDETPKVMRPSVNGKTKYARIAVRLRTPEETPTFTPVRDGEDFARRVAVIEQWFDARMRGRNIMLTFMAEELTDDQAEKIIQESEQQQKNDR